MIVKYNKILTKQFLLKKYIKERKSSFQIAKEINCGRQTVLNYLEKFKIKRRNISESKKGMMKAEKNSNWKNGISYSMIGYKRIYVPNHPYAFNNKYVLEHRSVMEKHLGRYLKPEEVVHHINGVKNDNRLENLILFESEREHQLYHNRRK